MRTRCLVSLPVFLMALHAGAPARAEVPTLLSFQGMLRSSTSAPLQGAQSVRFSIFNAPIGNQSVTGETATFSGAASTVTLAHTPVVPGSETVVKSDGSATYARNVAYTIDNANGVLTNVTIPAGTAVRINYQWAPSAFWTEEQAVQCNGGLFAALLGVNISIPYNAFTGSEWLQIEVKNASGVYESLGPRQRLTAAPYALRVATLDGATGGEVQGDVTATGSVNGTGASYSFGRPPFVIKTLKPGVQGSGVSGAAGEAPGVLAIGANDGAGLALSARGSLATTGDASVGANLRVKGSTTTEGASYTYGNGQVSGLLSVGNLTAAGGVTAGMDVTAGGNLVGHGTFGLDGAMTVGGDATLKGVTHVWKGLTVGEGIQTNGTIYTNTDMTVNNALSVRNTATMGIAAVTRDATIGGALSVTGAITGSDEIAAATNLRAGGRIYALGMPKPDYETTINIGNFDAYKEITLPSWLGLDVSNWTFEVYNYEHVENSGKVIDRYVIPGGNENFDMFCARVTEGGVTTARFGISKHMPDTRSFDVRLRIWKINY